MVESEEIRLEYLWSNPNPIYYSGGFDTYWKYNENNSNKLEEFRDYNCSVPTNRYGICTGLGTFQDIEDGVIYIRVS